MNFAGKSGSSNLSGFNAHGDSFADAVTIPDAHLLFSGDYQRSGADLIVSDQLHRVVVADYFHGEKRPPLVSPEGARLDSTVIDALIGHVQYAQAGGTAAAAKVIGHVVKMTGSASIVRNGVTITLNNGDVVYQNDVVQTGSGSTLGLVMIDGTTFNMSANARLMMNDLTYDAASTSNSSLFTLVQGAATFVAGQVAKTGDMKVSTPVATMGIRGTAVILDISAVDGTVTVSVVNQRDGQLHALEVFNTRGERIGTVTSNGSVLTLTPTASFEVIAQESNKSVAQVIAEFNAFQQLLSTYEIGKQLRPDTPAPTDGRRGDNDQQPLTKFAGSTISPIDSSVTKYNEPLGGTKDAKGGAADDVAALTPTGDATGTTTKVVVNLGDGAVQVVEVAATSIPFVVTPSPVSRISSGAGDHFGPVMSADGQFVTYDPDGAIYLFERQTGTTKTIAAPADGFTYGSPTISADGHFIVYQGSNGTQSFIFIYNNDASDPAHYGQTTRLGPGGQPAVSGDGSKIVIEQGGSIALYDQQGHQLADITAAALGITGGLWKPAISADGHVIAFWNSDQPEPGGSGRLFTYDLSSATFRSIASTNTDVGSSAASFSADGHYIVYQSDAPGGHSEIYLVDLRSGQTVFHTANTEASYNPVISPDGHFIIFASDARLTADDSNNFTDVYVVDVSDPAHPLFKLVSVLEDGTQGDAASDLGATISAGGQFIAFGSRASNFSTGDNNRAGDIFVVDPSSGHSAIILESRHSPAVLSASGVIKLTGQHAGVTLGASDSRITASFDANGDIQWRFDEARSDFGSLQPGEIAVRNFVITLGTGRSTTEIPVKVTIYDVDQTPVPVADAAPVASPVTLPAGTEDTGYTVTSAALLAGVIDIDGPSLAISGLSVVSGGGTIIDNHDGTFGYTPAPNYNGPVVFNYTVSDGTLSASSTASLNIAAVNDAPVVRHAALEVSEGGTVVLTSSDIVVGDPDSATFTFTASGVSHGKFQTTTDGSTWADATAFSSADLNAGHVRFVHDGGEDAPTFSIQADDGAGGSSGVVAGSVAFTNVNDAPEVTHAALTVSEGGTVVLDATNITVGDPDSTTFTFTSSNVSHGKFQTTADGSTWADATTFTAAELGASHVRFVHDGGEDAPTFSIQADDGAGGLSSVFAGSVAFTNVDDAPEVTHAALTVSEGGTVVLDATNFTVGDPDSTSFSFAVSNVSYGKFQTTTNGSDWADATAFSSADLIAGHVRFVHDGGEDAPAFSIRADDGAGGSSGVVAGSVAFTNVDDAPVFTGQPAGVASVGAGKPVLVVTNVSARDVDSSNYGGGLLTASVTSGARPGDTLSIIQKTPFIFLDGSTVMFDGEGTGSTSAVAIGTLTLGPALSELHILLNANAGDEAVAALTQAIQFSAIPPGGNAIPGTRTVSFSLTDGGGAVGGFDATVDVIPNHAPVAVDDSNSIAAGSSAIHGNVLANDSEPDHETLSVSGAAHATSGPQTITVEGTYGELVITKATGEYSYTLGASRSQADAVRALGQEVTATESFTYTASDGTLGADATLRITVIGVNEAPTVTPLAESITEDDGIRTFDLLSGAQDADSSDHLSVEHFVDTAYDQNHHQVDVSDAIAAGAVVVSGSTITLDPQYFNFLNDGERVTLVADYDVSDGHALAHNTAMLTINGVNDAPAFSGASAGTAFAAGGSPVAVTVNVTASDVDSESYHGGSLTATVTAGGGQGDTLSIANTQFISVSGNTVMFDSDAGGPGDAVELGTLTSNFNTLTVTLNNNAGDAAVKALAEAIRFENATPAPASGTRTVTFTLNDGGGTANGGDDEAYFQTTVTVATSVNHAPGLSDSALADVDEDTSAPAGESVGTLFGGKFHDIDQGSSFKGVAVVDNHATNSQGTWQYTTQQGGIWEDVGAVDVAHALIFSTATMLRFVPAPDFNGTPGGLQVVGIDDSHDDDFTTGNAQPGGRYTEDVSDRGGSTPFSDQAVTLGVTVSAVNDAPVASGSATLAAIDEDNTSPPGDTIGNLFGGNFSDAADNQTAAASDGSHVDTFAGIAISHYTPDAAKGDWEYATAGSNWVVLGAATATAAITLSADVAVRFVPAPNYNGNATALAANLIENGATIVNGAIVDLTIVGTGGSTHVSAMTVALGETINPVDDAPVIDGGDTRSVSVDENTTAVTTVVAHDLDGPSLTWSVVTGGGSPDASKFTIGPGTGALSFRNAPDFGHPTDSNHNNIYTVQVNVTDGTLSDTQTLFVNVTDVNDNAPVITTGAFQFVAENHTFVTQLSAFDVDTTGEPTIFSIADGLDGSLFQIDANGNLRFAAAPDFEHPADSNHNNIYSVTVNASDGLNSSSKTLFVTVTNVNEAPVLAPDAPAVTYIENAAPLALMSVGTVTDPDNPSNFDDGSLSVTLNGALAGDELVLSSIGGVSISGSSVKVGGVTVGTVSGNHSTHLTVDFNSNATDSRVEAVLHALAFDSTSDNPTTADRSATVTFNDGSNDGSGPALSDSSTVTIHVNPQNDAPHAFDDVVITNNAINSTYKIPEWVLLANDTDPDTAVLDVTLISSPSGFASISLTSSPGNVTINDNSPVGGSFNYAASDGSSTATAHVTVTQASGTMNGGSGNEIFIGDSSASTINAKAGDDILIGNGGNDSLDGGPGNDIYVFGLADGRDTIAHSSGVDTIRIEAGGAALTGVGFAEDSQDNLVIQFNGQQITVTDQFDDSTVGALQFGGGASYAGYDLGGDVYSLSDDSGTTRNGTSGNDILAGDAGGNTINGGDGKDLLFGNAGNDTLNGGTGNDLLVGGAGNDFMSGGPGNDTFVFAAGSGRDTISDFIPGQDKISLDYHAFDTADFGSWLNSHASSVNGGHDVLIDLNVDGHSGGIDTILLQNVAAVTNLHAGDFVVH